ncbi:sigma-70 family RNA polymerase sigma factor [Actinoplanes sp. LDG1-06]|uniref:Sigma-70 family RNA polymerase sigma factor n=1 Tax=Paractinoplanes ovalisporus TaxID=2810368 RepID=A0ABS2ASG1_9ACTN|nr:sigma-70 family RNA polymerase sigma factor [Actinoplanes ovalisporus]MBM2622775.1 sigma-70 family RNA polymerase sigma factor [Actinoplanes ovalisporus]
MNADDRRRRFEAVAPSVIDAVGRFLARRTDAATADDVLQETLLVCWRRLDEMPAGELLPWAYGVARNCLANAERGQRRQGRLFARILRLDPPRDVVVAPDTPDEGISVALRSLRREDAELLRLWAWEELSPGEIGTVLGISANAAGIRLHRARQKLRDALRKPDGAGGHEELTEGRRP